MSKIPSSDDSPQNIPSDFNPMKNLVAALK
jgi:hypothetical protein